MKYRRLSCSCVLVLATTAACSKDETTDVALDAQDPSDFGTSDTAALDGATDPESGGDSSTPPDAPRDDTSVTPTDGSVTGGPTGCKAIAIGAGATIEGNTGDTFQWSDSECKTRIASMLRNDKKDAFGGNGGYLRAISYESGGKTHNIKGTGTNGWQGFGYVVTHFGSGATHNQGVGGTYRTVLAGTHHAIYEYSWRLNPGGPVDVKVQWMFATGRSHPLYAITYDATPAGSNKVKADSRAPYGDLAWDDGTKGAVSGVGWGDKNVFTTTGPGPVTPSTPWDYSKPNKIPHAYEWSTPTDSEMGLVATQTMDTYVQGGDYGVGTLGTSWGKTGTKLLTDIPDWAWPFQLNQYELPFGTTSHRVAWGATYGAVGQTSYTSFGKTQSGYPYQSYTVEVVLGSHAPSSVAAAVSEIESIQGVKLSATRGTIAIKGPAGIARTDETTYVPSGFDPVYAAWAVNASANAATVSIDTAGASIRSPMFELRGYTATTLPSKVTLGGKSLTAGVDYFATVDASAKRLWITINGTLSGSTEISIV